MSEKESQPNFSELKGPSEEPALQAEKQKKDYSPEAFGEKIKDMKLEMYLKLYDEIKSKYHNNEIKEEEYKKLINKLNDLSIKELGCKITEFLVSDEELEFTQSVYDFLNLDYDLKEHIKEKGIDLIPRKQKKAVSGISYTNSLIIPGDMERDEFLDKIQKSFAKEFNSSGIYHDIFYNERKYQETQTAKDNAHEIRPPRPYQIMLLNRTEPEWGTGKKSFPQCIEILKKINMKNPNFNLKGMTLLEYMMLQATYYHKAKIEGKTGEELKKSHLDIETSTWLLEELILDEKDIPGFILCSHWSNKRNGLIVGSDNGHNAYVNRGARFVALPLKPITNKE